MDFFLQKAFPEFARLAEDGLYKPKNAPCDSAADNGDFNTLSERVVFPYENCGLS
jgi:hypothetical protein